jgi:hypothetical protein
LSPVPGTAARRLSLLASGLAVFALVGTLLSAPVQAATAPPPVNQAAAAQQCAMSFGLPNSTDAATAASLMQGRVNLGRYGSFTLAANPTWRPVSTLDSSGDSYMHALYYLLPLLREGVRTNNTAMLVRFYTVLADWIKDNPATGPTRSLAWNLPMVVGYRALALTCAAAVPGNATVWLRQALYSTGAWLAWPANYDGSNNASLHQSMGLLAIGAAIGRPDWERIAVSRISSLAVRLIKNDGSDGEGAPAYAVDNYQWFIDAAERIRRAGLVVPSTLSRVTLVPAFLAQAVRPDGKLEALGDTTPAPLPAGLWTGTAAEWTATGGQSGTPPTSTYATYAGGYVFGRSGWGTQQPYSQETFYSVRFGPRSGIVHAHDDSGALTLYSQGSELLFDVGQWRYSYGATRNYVVSRAAHNVVVVDGVARSTYPAPTLVNASTGDFDVTTVVDRGYRGVTLTRTIVYDRAQNLFVVWDRLVSAASVKASQQWGLGPDRGTTVTPDMVSSTGAGANVSLLFTGGSDGQDVVSGAKAPWRGWNSSAYGQLSPAPSVRSTQFGSHLSWVTVIAPRAAGVSDAGLTATSTSTDSSATVGITTPAGGTTWLALTNSSAAVTAAPGTVPATVSIAPRLLKQGSPLFVRASSLVPGEPVSLERQDGGVWSSVASGVASAAGTVGWRIVPTSSGAYRVVSSAGPTAAVPVVVAMTPGPVTGLVVTTSHRSVTVRWRPPASNGGLPISGYIITVAGMRVVVPPTTFAALFTVVPARSQPVSVVAGNALGAGAPAATRVWVASS